MCTSRSEVGKHFGMAFFIEKNGSRARNLYKLFPIYLKKRSSRKLNSIRQRERRDF